jgi:hypothetical protein
LLELEYALAPSCKGGELTPPPSVAAEASRLTIPRKVLAPFTSSIVAGELVPMPTLLPDSAMIELPSAAGAVHIGKYPEVPVPFDVTANGTEEIELVIA